MKTGRPKAKLILSDEERAQLEAIMRSRSLPAGLVRRARIVWYSAQGEANAAIAKRLKLSPATVGLWRGRFIRDRLAGLHDELRPGRPRSLSDERVAELIHHALQSKPAHATHWSERSFAQAQRVSPTMVHRLFNLFAVQPHRAKSFKISNDPFFVEKVRDIVGLYLNPPDCALVLCVDEKTQIQALNRTQPLLPMGLGYAQGVTHDYVRHGTTTLFAALDIASGQVLAQCKPRHRHQEFLCFLRHIDAHVPAELDIHLIIDNYSTHKHPKVRAWLAARGRYHVHYTPTYGSWLNQVERWFALISAQAIRRGSFSSVKELIARIQTFVHHYNQSSTPFMWTATADSILAKLKRLMSVICAAAH